MKIIARDTLGQISNRKDVREAREALPPPQLDRYWRAVKVWFNTESKQFEYEDRS